jgi:hypothetical protein
MALAWTSLLSLTAILTWMSPWQATSSDKWEWTRAIGEDVGLGAWVQWLQRSVAHSHFCLWAGFSLQLPFHRVTNSVVEVETVLLGRKEEDRCCPWSVKCAQWLRFIYLYRQCPYQTLILTNKASHWAVDPMHLIWILVPTSCETYLSVSLSLLIGTVETTTVSIWEGYWD